MKNYYKTYQRKQEGGVLLGDILMWKEYAKLQADKDLNQIIPRTKKEYIDYEIYCIRHSFTACSWGYFWTVVFDSYWNIRHCYDTFYEFLVAHELTDYKERYI